jgi:tryptophanyl-tRNA synthetase
VEAKKRVLSGMRPTGRLHIGHYFGALQNWVKLQNDPQYECFFFIADWHALTSDYADTSQVAQNTIEIATDWLASGLDPEKCTMFIQSSVPEHAELSLLLSMVTPLGWLERVPTYKEALDNVKDKDLHTFGFLGYPVLQTSDIVMYGEPSTGLFVPVGEDQASHVELSREIVATFNSLYGFTLQFEQWRQYDYDGLVHAIYPRTVNVSGSLSGEPGRAKSVSGSQSESHSVSGSSDRAQSETRPITKEAFRVRIREEGVVNVAARMSGGSLKFFQPARVLVEPQVILTQTPRIPGTDGRKMSKSYGNFISLSESNDSIRTKSRAMITDPARKRRTDPGNPDVCPVFDWHKLFSPIETQTWAAENCRTAGIGCIECKTAMADNLIKWIEPVRARREEFAAHPEKVLRIIDEGSLKAREVAQKTMSRVREAVFNWKDKRAELTASQPLGKS